MKIPGFIRHCQDTKDSLPAFVLNLERIVSLVPMTKATSDVGDKWKTRYMYSLLLCGNPN